MSSGQILVCVLISTLSLVLLSDNRERVKHVWTANSHVTTLTCAENQSLEFLMAMAPHRASRHFLSTTAVVGYRLSSSASPLY